MPFTPSSPRQTCSFFSSGLKALLLLKVHDEGFGILSVPLGRRVQKLVLFPAPLLVDVDRPLALPGSGALSGLTFAQVVGPIDSSHSAHLGYHPIS